MAFPVVETTNESSLNTAGTSHVVSLPSGIQASNLILILLDKGSTAATFNTLSGWTELVDENSGNGITIWYRWADGAEGATVTFTSTASTRSAHTSYRISGAQDPAVQAPQLSTVATGTSANPNATTCTPTGGAKDYLWITMFGQAGEQADDDSLTTVTPTGFSNPIEKTCGTAGTNLGGMIASAQQQLNAASLDASAWTSSDTTAWRAYTIAVHPGVTGAAAETQDNQTSSASGTVVDPPFIVATRTSQNGTDSTSQVVTLPNGSNVSGRLVVVVVGVDGTGGVAWPSGWTEIFDGTTTDTELAVGYRFIDGTEGFDGTDDTITLTTASEQSNSHAYLISDGHHASTAPEAASAATGTAPGAPVNPPPLNPAGWGTEESLWIAAAANRFATIQTAPPADYSNLLAQNGGDTNAPLCTAQRILSAASEDPGTFTGGDTDWVATTIAIRPAGSGIDGTLAETQDAQTSTASGVLGYTGTSAQTQADQTSTAAGILGYSGTVARTQTDQTSTASGTVGGIGEVTGTLAETQDAQTSTATGQLGSSGVLAASQANQTATAAGWITITGTVTETQDNQTAAATGVLSVTGTLARTQANQTATASGWITITGLVARTQANQTCTATGFVGDLPVPSGHPLTVPSATHQVTAGGGHRVTAPSRPTALEVS